MLQVLLVPVVIKRYYFYYSTLLLQVTIVHIPTGTMNIFQLGISSDTSSNNVSSTKSLLSLPKHAVVVRGSNDETNKANDADGSNDDTAPSFLLLQLPINCSVHDFIDPHQQLSTGTNRSTTTDTDTGTAMTNAYFVTPDPTHDLCCVIESKGSSYTVHRVETSNQYIVIPPPNDIDFNGTSKIPSLSSVMDSKDASNATDKVVDTVTSSPELEHIPAHLISKKDSTTNRENSGSYFLELRPKQLRLIDLHYALQSTLFDPYNCSSSVTIGGMHGRSIFQLAASLQVSQKEIKHGLLQIPQAFAIPVNDDVFCLLADTIIQEYSYSIVTALSTMDTSVDQNDCNCDDYGGVGIVGTTPTKFIDSVYQDILTNEERQRVAPYTKGILKHCLQLLLRSRPLCIVDSSSTSTHDLLSTTSFVLDVSKVAICIVRRLFTEDFKGQLSWNEVSLFTKWQSELPGVGSIYTVSRTMLLGVAICTTEQNIDLDATNDMINIAEYGASKLSSEHIWHYLPVESIHITDPQECFDTLFTYKSRWYMYEIEPYVQHIINSSSNNNNNNGNIFMLSSTELLLRYTIPITNDYGNGRVGTYYLKK